jgi:hypothetical protein
MKRLVEEIRVLVKEITFKKLNNFEPLHTSKLLDSMGTIDLVIDKKELTIIYNER